MALIFFNRSFLILPSTFLSGGFLITIMETLKKAEEIFWKQYYNLKWDELYEQVDESGKWYMRDKYSEILDEIIENLKHDKGKNKI